MFDPFQAEIQQLALIGSSSSLHSEVCNALGASDGVIHSSISYEVASLRASTNEIFKFKCSSRRGAVMSTLLAQSASGAAGERERHKILV